MPARKKTSEKKVEKAPSFFDYFRFGESYTSLILGILAVIIATGLLLGFVHNRNVVNRNIPASQISQNLTNVSQTETETVISTSTQAAKLKPTASPTKAPTPTPTPTAKPTLKPTVKPTSTPVPTKKPVTVKPTIKPSVDKAYLQGRNYTVKAGETLWSIAEKNYGSGYNWVDVARSNKLSNPNDVKAGQKLFLPKAEQKNATSEPEWSGLNSSSGANVPQANKIVGPQYVVRKGDNLWNIAVRAYGDGYKWTEIAKENKVVNPNLIYPGTTLNLTRK